MAAPRTVVVAVDASEHSRLAFEWYMSNIYRPDDEIVLCHVPETPSLSTFSFKQGLALPTEEWQAAIQQQLEKVRKLEEDYEALLIQRKIKYRVKGEACKNPGEGVVKVCDAEKANLVVMGTRGLDVIRRTLLGSVSDYVVRHSRIPTLICPK